jgi:hypothetical protein
LTRFILDELHVTPLTNTVQLRPTLSYIDKSDEKEKASAKRAQQEEVKQEKVKPAGKAQTVQVSKTILCRWYHFVTGNLFQFQTRCP